MGDLSIHDSCLNGELKEYGNPTARQRDIELVYDLKERFESGEVQLLHLSPYHVNEAIDAPVWLDKIFFNKQNEKHSAIYCSSHFIGSYSSAKGTLEITPRFGRDNEVMNYLLSYVANLYIPKGSASFKSKSGYNDWLIVVLWKALLDKAMTSGQIPKEYKTETKNIRSFKGHLNIAKHIKANLTNASKFYCTYRKLTMDNVINRTIRYTMELMRWNRNNEYSGILEGMASYDRKLDSFGVSKDAVSVEDIANIRFTKLNMVYKPVMEFSKAIINRQRVSVSNEGDTHNVAYFLDMAEIWELYLLKVLQKRLPEEFRVYSPNMGDGDFLMEDGYRSIRPDIIIEKNGRIVMIIDAKYKRYTEIGKTGRVDGKSYTSGYVSRDDLYQMSTYLYYYGKDHKIVGLFTSPGKAEKTTDDLHPISTNSNHQIGLLNLDIDSVYDEYLEKIKEKLPDYSKDEYNDVITSQIKPDKKGNPGFPQLDDSSAQSIQASLSKQKMILEDDNNFYKNNSNGHKKKNDDTVKKLIKDITTALSEIDKLSIHSIIAERENKYVKKIKDIINQIN